MKNSGRSETDAECFLEERHVAWRLMNNASLLESYRRGAPIEELERLLAGSLALSESHSKIEFYASQAAGDENYWLRFFQSRVNSWPLAYKAPMIDFLEDDIVPFGDAGRDKGYSPRIAAALRDAALKVYEEIEKMLNRYRGSPPA